MYHSPNFSEIPRCSGSVHVQVAGLCVHQEKVILGTRAGKIEVRGYGVG